MNNTISTLLILTTLLGCGGSLRSSASAPHNGLSDEAPESEERVQQCWPSLIPDRDGARQAAEAYVASQGTPSPHLEEVLVMGGWALYRDAAERELTVERRQGVWSAGYGELSPRERRVIAVSSSVRSLVPDGMVLIGIGAMRADLEDLQVVSVSLAEEANPHRSYSTYLYFVPQGDDWVLRAEEGDATDLGYDGPSAIRLLLEREGLILRNQHSPSANGTWGGGTVGGRRVIVAYGDDCDGERRGLLIMENNTGEWTMFPTPLDAFRSAVTAARTSAREAFESAHPHEIRFRTHNHTGPQIYFVDAEGVLHGAELRMHREAGTDPTVADDWRVELTPRRDEDMALARALYQFIAAEGGTLVSFNSGQRARFLWIDLNAERAAGMNHDAHPGPYATTVHYTIDGETHSRRVEAVLPEGAAAGSADNWDLSFTPE